jgi:hypothetical protein
LAENKITKLGEKLETVEKESENEKSKNADEVKNNTDYEANWTDTINFGDDIFLTQF